MSGTSSGGRTANLALLERHASRSAAHDERLRLCVWHRGVMAACILVPIAWRSGLSEFLALFTSPNNKLDNFAKPLQQQ
jgi:hypothetical protein